MLTFKIFGYCHPSLTFLGGCPICVVSWGIVTFLLLMQPFSLSVWPLVREALIQGGSPPPLQPPSRDVMSQWSKVATQPLFLPKPSINIQKLKMCLQRSCIEQLIQNFIVEKDANLEISLK